MRWTVSGTSKTNDPLWPRAGHWIQRVAPGESPDGDLAIVGVPAYKSSITPTSAHTTPPAVRAALARYSTFAGSRGIDVSALRAIDLGDVEDPDGPQGEDRVRTAVDAVRRTCKLLIALGGDNSITYPVMRALASGRLEDWGLITVDAHHDLRDGTTNGSPVRRLVEAGLPGAHVVQIGIADFSNSPAYAQRARELGITVVHRGELRQTPLSAIVARALQIAGSDDRHVYVDLDVDVCDRAVVPGCPSAAPGGISADDLRHLAFLFGRDPRVAGIDIAEVDAGSDSPDGRTVRLAALLVLEAAAGLYVRKDLLRA
jgi:formiminoglutamase